MKTVKLNREDGKNLAWRDILRGKYLWITLGVVLLIVVAGYYAFDYFSADDVEASETPQIQTAVALISRSLKTRMSYPSTSSPNLIIFSFSYSFLEKSGRFISMWEILSYLIVMKYILTTCRNVHVFGLSAGTQVWCPA